MPFKKHFYITFALILLQPLNLILATKNFDIDSPPNDHGKLAEGYWNDEKNNFPRFPFPKPKNTPFEGQAEFLQKLAMLESKANVSSFKGFSICRLCHQSNGSKEYSLGKFKWPSGYRHYIEAHNVRPSRAFYRFVCPNGSLLNSQNDENSADNQNNHKNLVDNKTLILSILAIASFLAASIYLLYSLQNTKKRKPKESLIV